MMLPPLIVQTNLPLARVSTMNLVLVGPSARRSTIVTSAASKPSEPEIESFARSLPSIWTAYLYGACVGAAGGCSARRLLGAPGHGATIPSCLH